mmetsp:Transcript_16340/g.48683  ORF Transcript_16340/g.48683 Transcript_16340/m.48683 type:complete len:202 (+) Transcript_16340:2468-3073(+)
MSHAKRWPLAVHPAMRFPSDERSHLTKPPDSIAPTPRSKLAWHSSEPAAASHSRARPSTPTLSRRRESPDHEQSYTRPSCALMSYSRQLRCTSQIRMSPFSLPSSTRVPSNENFTVSPFPSSASSRLKISTPASTSITHTCSSAPLLMTWPPSGEMEQHSTGPVCAAMTCLHSCVTTSQMMTMPSASPETMKSPLRLMSAL